MADIEARRTLKQDRASQASISSWGAARDRSAGNTCYERETWRRTGLNELLGFSARLDFLRATEAVALRGPGCRFSPFTDLSDQCGSWLGSPSSA